MPAPTNKQSRIPPPPRSDTRSVPPPTPSRYRVSHRSPREIHPPTLSVTVRKSIDLQHRERARGVSRRSSAAYLQPARPAQVPSRCGTSHLHGCGPVTCSPARRPYRPECRPCGIRSGWPWRCWHDGGRRARRGRPGADRAQQGSRSQPLQRWRTLRPRVKDAVPLAPGGRRSGVPDRTTRAGGHAAGPGPGRPGCPDRRPR